MILNTFTRKDRKNYYLQFSDPETGKRRVMVTAVRKGEPDARLKLAKIVNRMEQKILQGQETRPDDQEHGWGWVLPWIEERYGRKRPSLIKHRNQWNYLSAFFAEKNVCGPGSVLRDHALQYITWRRAHVKEKSKRRVGRNTALADLRWGGTLLREAIERNAITRNPWDKLGFGRDDPGERPELLDEQIAIIRKELPTKPQEEWMRISFEIALYTGLRFSETRILLRNVDVGRWSALIEAPKGGRKRAYTIPIPLALRPMFLAMKNAGQRFTWTVPDDERAFTGLVWSEFFQELNFGVGYCFHCTRVTFISRGCRAGVPENVMMKLVNHASAEVHRIYLRLTVADVSQYVDRIQIPKAPSSKSGSPDKKPSHRKRATRA